MMGMKSSIVEPALSLLRVRIINLVLMPSLSNCSSMPNNFDCKVSRILLESGCPSILRMLVNANSLSLMSVFYSGLFHSAMTCLSSIS